MKKTLVIPLLLLTSIVVNGADLNSFFNKADTFFKKYVHDGRVAYKSINANFSEIQSLYSDINTMNLAAANDNEKKAFYINAYNLVVIYQVSKYYPLKSPLDQSGFFDKVKHQVAGQSMTLNSLEILKLIQTYKDPRVHFALACAAKSCPPLPSFSFLPNELDTQLTTRTKLSIDNKDWLKVRPESNKVALSKIFDWYKKDFTMDGSITVIDFINKYKKIKIPSNYEISYYEYSWELNDEG
ncbi:MAG TPA: DUF547 domain-containing protein [Fulvivirga sp.]|nr:DUF547 domain-containing protein [Fulvivirga sp.]